jgi:hypothetical protein
MGLRHGELVGGVAQMGWSRFYTVWRGMCQSCRFLEVGHQLCLFPVRSVPRVRPFKRSGLDMVESPVPYSCEDAIKFLECLTTPL